MVLKFLRPICSVRFFRLSTATSICIVNIAQNEKGNPWYSLCLVLSAEILHVSNSLVVLHRATYLNFLVHILAGFTRAESFNFSLIIPTVLLG